MALTADRHLTVSSIHERVRNILPMAASVKAYQDGFAGLTAGTVRPLVAGDKFAGVFCRQFDNSSGGASAINAEVESGHTVEIPVTGVTGITNIGALVYATDDATATLTAQGGSLIGAIRRYMTGTTCKVHLFTEAELAAF